MVRAMQGREVGTPEVLLALGVIDELLVHKDLHRVHEHVAKGRIVEPHTPWHGETSRCQQLQTSRWQRR